MTKKEAIKQVIEMLESNNAIKEKEAYEIAYKYDIVISELWDDDDIIGLTVEDDVIYF